MTLVWIGGAGYPEGGWEYNATADLAATQYVFNQTNVAIHQFPQPVYRHCLWSIAEMEWELTRMGEFGSWLYQQFTSPPEFVQLQGSWPMGDSPVVLVTSLGVESSIYQEVGAPSIGDDLSYGTSAGSRKHQIYTQLDFRLIINDFVARLGLHHRS